MINKTWVNTILLLIIVVLLSIGLYVLFTKQIKDTINKEVLPISTTTPELLKESTKAISIGLDLSSEIALQHKEILSEAFKKPADFNEHYVVASWGCGSGCQSYSIIDKLTGKFYPGPADDFGNKAEYFGDDFFNSNRYSVSGNTFKAIGYDSINVFHFENEKFVKTGTLPFPNKRDISTTVPAPYIRVQAGWPPIAKEQDIPYSCTVGSIGMGVRTVTSEKIIYGRTYCISISSEGAMGTTYKTYTYTTPLDAKVRIATFILAFSNADGCSGHSTPEENKCQEIQASFDVDAIVDNIFFK